MPGWGLRVGDVTNAVVDALVADTTLKAALGGTAKVYSYVPEDTTSPYLHVLGSREAPWARVALDDSGREVDVDIDVWSAYRGTKQVDDLASQALTTVTADTPYSGVSGYAGVLFVGSERPTQEFISGELWYRRRLTIRVFCE